MEGPYLDRALELAFGVLGNTSPNPPVGAVLARDGRVIAEGATEPAGQRHAEIVALDNARQAGDAVRGATLFVSLEPCCHHGRTPPCTDAIVAAGVGEVVAATADDNPAVAGRSGTVLEGSGIKVRYAPPPYAERAAILVRGHRALLRRGYPHVTAKLAQSLDGYTATVQGDSRWISGPASRQLVHRLRGKTDAVMVGLRTALADNPRLSVRLDPHVRLPTLAAPGDADDLPGKRHHLRHLIGAAPDRFYEPRKVLLADASDLPGNAHLFASPEKVIVASGQRSGATSLGLLPVGGRYDLREVLQRLGALGIATVLVESGGELTSALLVAGLIDDVWLFTAPLLLGGGKRSVALGNPPGRLADAWHLRDVLSVATGPDMLHWASFPEKAVRP